MKHLIIFLLLVSSALHADDWPQWLGPNRDSVWKEEGIVTEFPESGPEILWRVPVGYGYSGAAISGGRVYLTDYLMETESFINNPAKTVAVEGTERLLCLDINTGKILWKHEAKRPYQLSYPGGPRATPTIVDGKVYSLGAMGDLLCADAESGKVIWEVNLPDKFGGKTPIWGHSAHPLVHGDLLYVLGGGEGNLALALDKMTGEKKWGALTAPDLGYCPPSIINHAGVEQLIIWTPLEVSSLNPKDGSVYWAKSLKPDYNMSVTIPQKSGNKLFASGMGRKGALIKLNDEKPEAEVIWRGKAKTALYTCNSTPVIVNETIYGVDVDTSQLMGVSMEDGERLWGTTKPVIGKKGSRDRHGTAFLTYHEPSELFYLWNEAGELIIAELSSEGYSERSVAKILEPSNEVFNRQVVWSAPAFAQKSAFLRNDKEFVRVNLAK